MNSPAPVSSDKLRSWLTTLVGLGLSAAALYLALREVELRDLWQALRQAQPLWLGAALVSVMVNAVAKVFRWQAAFGPAAKHIPFARLMRSLWVGQLWNLVYPARVGDLSRVWVVGRSATGRAYALGTVLVEKLLDMLSYAGVALLLLLTFPLEGGWRTAAWFLAGLGAVSLAGGLTLVLQRQLLVRGLDGLLARLPGRLCPAGGRLRSWLLVTLDGLEALRSPALPRLLAWTAVVWISAWANNLLVLWAMRAPLADLQTEFSAALLVLIGAQASFVLPAAPGRVGIFEYVCILALTVFGIEQSLGLGYGLALHAVVSLPVAVLGFASALMDGWLERGPVEGKEGGK